MTITGWLRLTTSASADITETGHMGTRQSNCPWEVCCDWLAVGISGRNGDCDNCAVFDISEG